MKLKTMTVMLMMVVLITATPVPAQNATFTNIKFLGGTAPFENKKKITMIFDDASKSIILQREDQHASFPYDSVTRITYGKNVRRRIKETVLLGVTLIGLFALPILFSKKKEHQILVEYKAGETAGAIYVEADKNRYKALLGTLSAKTGVTPTTEVEDK